MGRLVHGCLAAWLPAITDLAITSTSYRDYPERDSIIRGMAPQLTSLTLHAQPSAGAVAACAQLQRFKLGRECIGEAALLQAILALPALREVQAKFFPCGVTRTQSPHQWDRLALHILHNKDSLSAITKPVKVLRIDRTLCPAPAASPDESKATGNELADAGSVAALGALCNNS